MGTTDFLTEMLSSQNRPGAQEEGCVSHHSHFCWGSRLLWIWRLLLAHTTQSYKWWFECEHLKYFCAHVTFQPSELWVVTTVHSSDRQFLSLQGLSVVCLKTFTNVVTEEQGWRDVLLCSLLESEAGRKGLDVSNLILWGKQEVKANSYNL